MEYKEFKATINKVTGSRRHRIMDSLGMREAIAYYRKNRPIGNNNAVTSSQYYSIIRSINNLLVDKLLLDGELIFPNRMGKLEIRKWESIPKLKDGKLIYKAPVDWDKTLKLWYKDSEAYSNKTIIKTDEKWMYKIHYNKIIAVFNNKLFYDFNVNRNIKKRLKEMIKENKIEAFIFKTEY